jgi:uncharacterized RDD family membrane protein YckC
MAAEPAGQDPRERRMTQDRVVTPEAVALELQTAGAGSRLAAALLDWFVVLVSLYALSFLLALGVSAASAGGPGIPGWVLVTAFILVITFGLFGYFIIQETLWRGRTLGKALFGLRVVTGEGGQIRFRHAFIRGIFLLIDGILTSGCVGVVAILTSPRNQRLGDMVAGTIVLRERTALRAPTAVVFPPPRGLEHYTAMLDTTRLGMREYQTVRSFLLRAPSLHPTARYQLAVQIADPIRDLVRPLPPDGIQPELFLAAVAAAAQQRQRAAPRPPGPPGVPPPSPPPVEQPPLWRQQPQPPPLAEPQPAQEADVPEAGDEDRHPGFAPPS